MLTRILFATILAVSAFAVDSLFDVVSETSANAQQNVTVEVESGDTLGAIAAEHGVSVQAIAEANQIDDPALIFPGQVLQIPGVGGGTEQAANPAGAPTWESQWIEVDLTNQVFRAWEGEQVVYSGPISSGRAATPTLTGTFETYVHLRYDDMSGTTPDQGAYALQDVPHVMYYDRGYGLHGTYWHNNFGTPMSAGCVNLTLQDAEWVFNWAGGAGAAGLTVHIHGSPPGF